MHAVILIGHGSLRSASGAAMIRLAARLRELEISPWVDACFLNYSRPTLAETAARCCERGVTQIAVQPYFLIAGAYVVEDLPRMVADVAADHPHMAFRLGEPLLDHPAMAELVAKRVREVVGDCPPAERQGLLLMAHGTPMAAANRPLAGVLAAARKKVAFDCATLGYLDCNTPTILDAARELVAAGAKSLVMMPYFLHLGRHVRDDLPRIVAQVRARYPEVRVVATRHLGYDPALVDSLSDRIRAIEVD